MSSTSTPTLAARELPPDLFIQVDDRHPLRTEYFGLEHLEAHARDLAAASVVSRRVAARPLLRRLRENSRRLHYTHRQISETVKNQGALTADAEWLLDNFYVIEEVLREVHDHLPRGYYNELPRLANGPLKGYPRVYALALALIAHTDSSLDETHVDRFVWSYQTVAPLTIGELWAVPTMLRLGLLENLRRLAEQVLQTRTDRARAEAWVAEELARGEFSPARMLPPDCLTDACVVGLLQALRDHGPGSGPAIDWLEDWLRRQEASSADVLRREHQRQAANQVSIGNCVTSLRLLAALDWNQFFERSSHVEAVLRDEPTGVYRRQDFATRDRYRRAVEQLARGSGQTEVTVARRAVERAGGVGEWESGRVEAREPQGTAQTGAPTLPLSHSPTQKDPRRAHVGYYLIDGGRRGFEKELRYRPRLRPWLLSLAHRHPNVTYFGLLALVFGLLLAAVLSAALGAGWHGRPADGGTPVLLAVLAALAAALPLSELAVGAVNYLLTSWLPPSVLPKLDFRDGLPPDCVTFVVIPGMLTGPESAAFLLERLELHYLANPDGRLFFALLTDFSDAPAQEQPSDAGFLRPALEGVKALNARYAPSGPDRFYVFHRRRQWNPVEGCWMGWERKRGKLLEFNRLLRGSRTTSYATQSGDVRQLPAVRYVLTLDADTQLPREAARRLVGTLAHPLNQAQLSKDGRRVEAGYGILQPRVSFSYRAGLRSRFAHIFARSAGIDPYSSAVSDVYQDLFGAGSFTGKGLYEVDAFEAVTGPAFPDNHILSHDLIEGNFARCGLVTDVELYDDFPAKYLAYARREHRWARGDWQLLPWLGRRVPLCERVGEWERESAGEPERGSAETRENDALPLSHAPTLSRSHSPTLLRTTNVLPLLERWKIFDNLRRSLVPPALLAMLALGWTVLPGSPWLWSLLALAVIALPLLLQVLSLLPSIPRGVSPRTVWARARADLPSTAGQVALTGAFLANEAALLADAILITLGRLYVSRKRLLEWETSAAAERRVGNQVRNFVRGMWPAVASGLALALLVGLADLWHWERSEGTPFALPAALPFLIAWVVSPAIAWWVSLPTPVAEAELTAGERKELRRLARKTWDFFETFVGPEDNWLPPDNYQEEPKGRVAHRTSPTNMGLALLSALAAHDLGYLSLRALADRLGNAFATLKRLERHQGHFLNWYNTRTLEPLQPGYLSTVDSGNLLGCLMTLKQGLRDKLGAPPPGPALAAGLADTLALVEEEARVLLPAEAVEEAVDGPGLSRRIADLQRHLGEAPADLLGWDDWLAEAARQAGALLARVRALAGLVKATPDTLLHWCDRLEAQLRERREALAELAPWLPVLRESLRPEGGARHVLETGERWQALCRALNEPAGLAKWDEQLPRLRAELDGWKKLFPDGPASLPTRLAEALAASSVPRLARQLRDLAAAADELAAAMDFRFLYNPERHLFSIGYNLQQSRLDNSYYDLLASEACLASFLAIARGDVPKRHWFQLGRPATRVAGRDGLLSWGGTMFEYLMPRLLLPEFPGTLLDAARRAAVARQIEYGRQNGVPWGVSESAFSLLDAELDYQYQSFGVPGLGLKRGLGADLVIAPYATALALTIAPREVLANFGRLREAGAEGPLGFYESIDYTRSRLPKGETSRVVRSAMAHHQGMILLALANRLFDDVMPRRLRQEPLVRSTELLLQERVPLDAPLLYPHGQVEAVRPAVREAPYPVSRRLLTADTPGPRTHLLSNGHYTVMVTNSGAGFSTCRSLDVTRWREDRTRDCWGQFLYLRDLHSREVWSVGHHPTGRRAERYEVVFSIDKAEFRRFDLGIDTYLEVVVSPERNAEVRRLTLTNTDDRPRVLEVTSYAEVVLGPHGGDLAHPAFGKLFLETEWLPNHSALLCRRRPRSPEQAPVWAVHVLATEARPFGLIQYETDRARFLGRRRTPAHPEALTPEAGVLSCTTGPVLDPIFSLREQLRLAPGTAVTLAFTTAVADTREEALALADQYHTLAAVTRAFELAWAHSRVELHHLNMAVEDVPLYQRLAGHLLLAGPTLRAAPDVLAANRQGQAGLWRMGISGDYPIVLVLMHEGDDIGLVRQMLVAHTYWRIKGFAVDLVVLNETPASYFATLQEQLQGLVLGSDAHQLLDKPGGVFLRKAAQLSEDDRTLLLAAARVVLAGDRGTLANQVDVLERLGPLPAPLAPGRSRPRRRAEPSQAPVSLPTDLLFVNGTGGFTSDGREYVLLVPPAGAPAPYPAVRGRGEGELAAGPPAPWCNVVANPAAGFLVSEAGGGYTWAGNSQSNRLTPWSNDPVSDPPGEAVYLRDEESGAVWSPTPLPVPPAAPTLVRHGQGYTTFTRAEQGLGHELTLFVPTDDPVKVFLLKVTNRSSTVRRLSATFYAEWVLGTTRDQMAPYTVTEIDPDSGALLARNAFNADFGAAVAFAAVNLRPCTWTGDRTEFLGRNRGPASPDALGRAQLSGRVGPGLDPCAALQGAFTLRPGESQEVVFLLGQAADRAGVRPLVQRYLQPEQARAALRKATARWDEILGAVQVQTPSPQLDLLLNRWLLYQVLSCRLWGRSAFYQSGGAYGFRDQLQDVMALPFALPAEARKHIVRASGRQFPEGDVQHWWHPPAGRGVRTRFSDDYLWLPFVVHQYVVATGDRTVLDESTAFLKYPPLRPEEEETYGLPEVSDQKATVYEHCVRALEHGWRLGAHGLPLMGTGDWNDGMNKVGAGGKGESVWVAWFLLMNYRQFAALAEGYGDAERAATYRERAEQLRKAIEDNAWDGGWYRRAYFDDGTPLGSAQNVECQIDSLTQSWAVFSGVADPARAEKAMAAVFNRLVRREDRLILLFDPPFDNGPAQPGYIKGYVPGIRENGGQYTHAAVWVVQAAALLGRGGLATDLFDLLNPVHHGDSPREVERYKVEPYVLAGDVYGRPPHTGRGGWTWYTGSASWLYRAGLETLLGVRREGEKLSFTPRIPKDWKGYTVTYRHGPTVYRISVANPHGLETGTVRVWLDGAELSGDSVPLSDDGRKTHEVRVELRPS